VRLYLSVIFTFQEGLGAEDLRGSAWVGSILTKNYCTLVDRDANNKHTSLHYSSTHYHCRRFYSTGPESANKKREIIERKEKKIERENFCRKSFYIKDLKIKFKIKVDRS
jgi:hypothetical protein